MKKITLLLLLLTASLNAQLSDFNLTVSKTNETCLGNGTLTFSVTNTTPNAAMLYKVYLLPDTATAIAITQQNYVGGLSAGNYKVEAIQSLGDEKVTKEQNVSILNNIVPFSFTVAGQGQNCSQSGILVVNATSGNAVSYEIISGPVTRPLQASNVFAGLPSGTYNVRAFNECGVGKVKTHTLTVTTINLTISDPVYQDDITPLCDSIVVNNVISASSGFLSYPLTVKHVISPLDISGDPILINQVFTSGDESSLTVSATMPRYLTQSYTYDISVTDNCENYFEKTDNLVDPNISLSLSTGDAPCSEKFLMLNASKFTDSFTVEFLSAPAGFNPADFNDTPDGPFTETAVAYGDEENPVPFGDYVVKITDACGRTATESISVVFVKPTPNASAVNNGCFSLFGKIVISVPANDIVSATILNAPAAYTENNTLPQDISGNLSGNPAKIVLQNMPLGVYKIRFIDECGFEYEEEVEVPPFVEKDFNIATLASCSAGFGSVRYRSGNGPITEAYIIAAQPALPQAMPYDISGYLTNNGQLFISDLPEGTYTFRGIDHCGIVNEKTIEVAGFQQDEDSFTYLPRCGNFAVEVHDASNNLQGAKFWLQKFYPATNSWGHPSTGVLYTTGAVPDNTNGTPLNNNALKNNLNFTGRFRIIKKYDTFGNGTATMTECVKVLGEFNYSDVLAINTAYTLACLGQPNDVVIEATGQPTSYKIIAKNGDNSFEIDNGNSNTFRDLEPAEYVFQIGDDCGNTIPKTYDLRELPSIADATQPLDMVNCYGDGQTPDNTFTLTAQNEQILGPLHSAMYTITYHLTEAEADAGTNALPDTYTSISNGQTIYARLVHNEISICHGITSFRLFVGEPQRGTEIITEGTICNDGRIELTASGNFDNYLWTTGETTKSIFVEQPGVYAVLTGMNYGTAVCDGGYDEVVIKSSVTPTIEKIETSDWTNDQNTITIYAQGGGYYEYSLDGVSYQESNVFTGLEPGIYQVHVKDAQGCGEDIKEVALLNYPNYFTPNGDGIHDTWYIKYSVLEPHFKVNVFDRYGKLITTFGSSSKGWDGTLNGIQLPSTDYWFVVTREDGRQHTGHFSMVR